jgi:hypothetical protein
MRGADGRRDMQTVAVTIVVTATVSNHRRHGTSTRYTVVPSGFSSAA